LLRTINTVVLAVPYMAGLLEESQALSIPLLEGFKDEKYWVEPITRARITLSRPHIQVYSSSVRIVAQFTGLRYFMYHWFFTSAFLGVLTFTFWQFFFLLAIYVSYKIRRSAEGATRGRRRRGEEEEERELSGRAPRPAARRKSGEFRQDVERIVGGAGGAASSSSSEPSTATPVSPAKKIPRGGTSSAASSDFFAEEGHVEPARPLRPRMPRMGLREVRDGEESTEEEESGSSDSEYGVESIGSSSGNGDDDPSHPKSEEGVPATKTLSEGAQSLVQDPETSSGLRKRKE